MFNSIFATGSIGARPGAADDFWYSPVTFAGGIPLTSDSAARQTAVYTCRKIISETIGQLPLVLYRRQPGGGKQRAFDEPLYFTLHDQPNAWQTDVEWKEYLTGQVVLKGNAIGEILPGSPLNIVPIPYGDVEKISRTPDLSLAYKIKEGITGPPREVPGNQILHVRGMPSDGGIVGLNPIEEQRQILGLAFATDAYSQRFFENDATPRGIIKRAGHFKDKEARGRFRESWQSQQTGSNRHKIAVLEDGFDYEQTSINAKDAQLIEQAQFSAKRIASIFRVPPHMINEMGEATFSNIEQNALDFVVHTMAPWFRRWEQAVLRDLIVDKRTFFAEFMVKALLRGDTTARQSLYASGISTGWLTRNEARDAENYNPLPGLDEPLQPLNLAPAGSVSTDEDDAAASIVRREIQAITTARHKHLEWTSFTGWLADYYHKQARAVRETMRLSKDAAAVWCERSRVQVLEAEDVLLLMEDWELTRVATLAHFTKENR